MAVTIPNSAGYGNDEVEAAEWAQIIPNAGAQYGVLNESSWVARYGSADREVRLSPGAGFGCGVLDRSTAEASIVLPASASGSVYHLIHVHRDWNLNRSTFDSKAGTSARQIPGRATTPGQSDDQPLWLARVDAGKSQVQELIDLRVWGGSYAVDDLVRQYMNQLGTVLRIGNTTWRRVIDTLGNPAWTNGDTGETSINLNGGWSVEPDGAPPTFRVRDGMVSLNGRIRAGASVATPHAFTLPSAARPVTERVVGVMRPNNTFETVIIRPDGQVLFYNVSLPANDYRLASIPPWPAAPGY